MIDPHRILGLENPEWGALPFSIYVDTRPPSIKPHEHCREVLSGVPGSPGLGAAPAFLHLQTDYEVWVDGHLIDDDHVDAEVRRFQDAVEELKREKRELQQISEQKVGRSEAMIFESHNMLLDDPEVTRKTIDLIRNEHRNAENAYYSTIQEVLDLIASFGTSEHMRDRTLDIEDIRGGVLSKLSGRAEVDLGSLQSESVIVSHTLTPSHTAKLDRETAKGFVTDTGGQTCHAAILARSMGIPAVVGCNRVSTTVKPGELVLIDGYAGEVFVGPDETLISEFREWMLRLTEHAAEYLADSMAPSKMLDGHYVSVMLNVELIDEVRKPPPCPVDGVGLFRTEFLFLSRTDLPDEEEQYTVYKELAEAFGDTPVTIRTMDVGGDKLSKQLHVTPEENPFLGWRAIRISLAHPELFRAQVRAILRASAHGNVEMMFPLVTSLDELVEALDYVEQFKDELRAEGKAFNPDIPVGVMIETPSAVMVADALAQRVSFFSIGTNDLVQYTLAVDRNNERVASLFDMYHPAVLRFIQKTVEAADRAGIPVHVCGEMAHEPLAALLLIGLGVETLSMAPGGIPEIKQLIRHFTLADVQDIAHEAMQKVKGSDVRTVLRQALSQRGLLSADYVQLP